MSTAPVTPAAIPTAAPAGATIQRDATVMRAASAAKTSAASGSSATGRSSKGASAVVAVASAVAVVAISVVVLAMLAGTPGQQDDAGADTTTTTTTTAPTTVPAQQVTPTAPPTAPPPDYSQDSGGNRPVDSGSGRSDSEAPYKPDGANGPGEAESMFWSIIVDSKRSRGDAEAVAARVRSMGYSPTVDFSSNYESLNPGYYVVHVGTYYDEGRAYAAQEEIRSSLAAAGMAEAYRRCFGDMPPCRANNPSIGN